MTAAEGKMELHERVREGIETVPFVAQVNEQWGERPSFDVITVSGDIFRLFATSPKAAKTRADDELVVARRMPRELCDELLARRVNFADAAGNLHLDLGGRYYAHVQGKRRARRLPAMRAAAYRVLLAWLLEPDLLSASIRDTADLADVSTTAVVDMQKRLDAWGYVVGSTQQRVWTPRGRKEGRRLWLEGYRTTLRPKLDLGGYQLQGAGPHTSNLTSVREVLSAAWQQQARDATTAIWGWGGAEALRHIGPLRNHFVDSGPVITIVVDPAVDDVTTRIPIRRSNIYNIRVRQLPFEAAMRHEGPAGWSSSVPHPLLVWTELMCDPDARVREAADELEKVTPEGWL